MAPGAALGKDDLAARHHRVVLGEVCVPSRCVGEMLRIGSLEHEESEVHRLVLIRFPVAGVLLCNRNLDRGDLLSADERIEMLQPLLTKEAYVEVHAIERSQGA